MPEAKEMLAEAKGRGAKIGEEWESASSRALESVHSWQYATDEYYPLFDPLGPESDGRSRGKLMPSPKQGSYDFGFDENGRLRVRIRRHGESARSVFYVEYCENGAIAKGYEEGVVGARPMAVYLRRHVSDSVGTLSVLLGVRTNSYTIRLWRKTGPYSLQLSLIAKNWSAQATYTATLGANGIPTRIVDQHGRLIYERPKGDVDKLLARLEKALIKAIPKLVSTRYGESELLGVCLAYGEAEERLPPMVVPLVMDEIKRHATDGNVIVGDEYWSPDWWYGRLEPIHFDDSDDMAVAKVMKELRFWLPEDGPHQKAEDMLYRVASHLNQVTWPRKVLRAPGFVVYAADYEGYGWRDGLKAALDSKQREILSAHGLLPPEV